MSSQTFAANIGKIMPDWTANISTFEYELKQLQESLKIPGLAYTIVKNGTPLSTNSFGDELPGVEEDMLARPFLTTSTLEVKSLSNSVNQTAVDLNVDDVQKYLINLTSRSVSNDASMEKLQCSSKLLSEVEPTLALDWLEQKLQEHAVIWCYHQGKSTNSGALLLFFPRERLSLFILANANSLNTPFQLNLGNVSRSPFALSFLRLFIFSQPNLPIVQRNNLLTPAHSKRKMILEGYDFSDELLAQGLIDN